MVTLSKKRIPWTRWKVTSIQEIKLGSKSPPSLKRKKSSSLTRAVCVLRRFPVNFLTPNKLKIGSTTMCCQSCGNIISRHKITITHPNRLWMRLIWIKMRDSSVRESRIWRNPYSYGKRKTLFCVKDVAVALGYKKTLWKICFWSFSTRLPTQGSFAEVNRLRRHAVARDWWAATWQGKIKTPLFETGIIERRCQRAY